MKFSLRAKLILCLLLIAAAGFTLLSTWGYSLVNKEVQSEMISELYQNANYLAASYKVNSGSIGSSEIQSMAYASSSVIFVIDMEGNILAYSGSESPTSHLQSFNPTDAGYYSIGTLYGTFKQDMIVVYAPLSVSVTPEGYVLLCRPLSDLTPGANSRMLLAYITYAGCVAFLVLLLLILGRIVIRPVQTLNRTAHEYANNNLSYKETLKSRDELGSISRTLEDIASQLNRSDDDQHRFMANISHDFRSPLTSIRGYLTAIQDGTIPVEIQGKYIDIVLNETERLLKLANGLLDMTQLENGIMLERSNFDINDLIREVLPTFEGVVEEKDILFNLTFEDQHQGVNGDRARILQVTYNLIDNAIKFSKPHSDIDISTSLHGDRIFVSVKDHGVGISKENLPKIWDRFFKTDASRGKDRKGTGLGLAIVREIIQAHGENIDVISTPDVGTEFIFTIKAV